MRRTQTASFESQIHAWHNKAVNRSRRPRGM
jgi:hypothetical protein